MSRTGRRVQHFECQTTHAVMPRTRRRGPPEPKMKRMSKPTSGSRHQSGFAGQIEQFFFKI